MERRVAFLTRQRELRENSLATVDNNRIVIFVVNKDLWFYLLMEKQ